MEEEKVLRDYVAKYIDIEDMWVTLELSQRDYKSHAIRQIVKAVLLYTLGLTLAVICSGDYSSKSLSIAGAVLVTYLAICVLFNFVLKPCSMEGLRKEFKRNKIKSIDRALALRRELKRRKV